MKIKSIFVKNAPPIKYFDVDNLSDVVIFAGPNGVGKSRLLQSLLLFFQNPLANPNIRFIIEATSKDESSIWGKTALDTSNTNDANLLKQILHQNRQRGNWKSGVLFFESDRSMQQVKLYSFSWDLPDPYEEQIGWQSTYDGIRNRYQDTVHSIFKMIEHQKRSIANRAIQLKNEGKTVMNLEFSDPVEPFKNAFSLLLSPKELLNPSTQTQRLKYKYQGQELDIDTLSSGEREVVNIVFDFILRKPANCIVLFDEPELHLHTELSHKLIQTLETAGENNQFVLCTHSPNLISSTLDNSVVFLAPPKDDNFNQAISVSETDKTNQALKLLGHSIGIIALGRKIVLIEGENSSLDKKTYESIIRNMFPNLVLVPSRGKDTVKSFANLYENVLNKTVWGVEFFMLTDRDTITDIELESIKDKSKRLKVLGKYHIENYFLDETIWAKVFTSMEPSGTWLTNHAEIKKKLKDIALSFISYAAALNVSLYIRNQAGNTDVMARDVTSKSIEEIQSLITKQANGELKRINGILSDGNINKSVQSTYGKLKNAFDDGKDEWKDIIPGRPILNTFIKSAGLNIARAKCLYIKEAEKSDFAVFDDIIKIFKEISNDK